MSPRAVGGLVAALTAATMVAAVTACILVTCGCLRGASVERTPRDTWRGCVEIGADGGTSSDAAP
jgi:hypothetical protein